MARAPGSLKTLTASTSPRPPAPRRGILRGNVERGSLGPGSRNPSFCLSCSFFTACFRLAKVVAPPLSRCLSRLGLSWPSGTAGGQNAHFFILGTGHSSRHLPLGKVGWTVRAVCPRCLLCSTPFSGHSRRDPLCPSPTLGLYCLEPLVTMTSLYRAISYKSHP